MPDFLDTHRPARHQPPPTPGDRPISSLTTATTPSTAAWALSPPISRTITAAIRASLAETADPRIHVRHACLARAARHLVPVTADRRRREATPFPPGATGAMRTAPVCGRKGAKGRKTGEEVVAEAVEEFGGRCNPAARPKGGRWHSPRETRLGDVWTVDEGVYGGVRVEWRGVGGAGFGEGGEGEEEEKEEVTKVETVDGREEIGNDDDDREDWDEEEGRVLLDGFGEVEGEGYYGLVKDYDGVVSDSDSESDCDSDSDTAHDEDEQEADVDDKFNNFDGDHTGGQDTGDHEHTGDIGQAD